MIQTSVPHASKRLFVLDSLRGLMLVLIGFDHYGGFIAEYLTYEPLGFVSAAEAFIFLAGFMVGLLYTKKILTNSKSVVRKLLERTLKIYCCYELTALFLLGVFYLSPYYRSFWVTLLPDDPPGSLEKIFSLLTLRYQAGYLQILSVYCLLFLVSPLVVWLIARGYARIVVTTSVLVYIIQPFGLTDRLASDVLFPVLTWQLLFVVGIYLGYRYDQGTLELSFRRPYLAAALVFCGACFLLREAVRFDLLEDNLRVLNLAFNRRHLSPMRLVNFFTLAYLFAALAKARPNWLKHPWLIFLGQHSLYVFVFQALVIYFWRPFRGTFGLPLESVVFVALCTVPAVLHRAWRLRSRRAQEAIAAQ